MTEFEKRCAREDEEDRLASLRHTMVPHLNGPQAVELAVACLLQATDAGALKSWNITFPESADG